MREPDKKGSIKKIKKIVIVGSGNVANTLALALHIQTPVVQILSRNTQTGNALAKLISCDFTNKWSKLKEADLYLVAVNDDSLQDVFHELRDRDGIVVHTSGANGLGVFPNAIKHAGYFYPLQTFSTKRKTNIAETPIFINANSKEGCNQLKKLATQISDTVIEINDDQKARLHTSAVVVNNFVNHLYALTYEFLNNAELDFELLKPIIESTIEKALISNPKEIQSGPAIRGDEDTIKKHLDLLKDNAELQDVYAFLTKQILDFHAE